VCSASRPAQATPPCPLTAHGVWFCWCRHAFSARLLCVIYMQAPAPVTEVFMSEFAKYTR